MTIANGDTGLSALTEINNSLVFQKVETGADVSYRIGNQNGELDTAVNGSLLFDGTATYPNKIGANNTRPIDEPAWGTRADDASYVAGGANVAGILAGYDNVNNSEAGMIAAQHSIIYTGADHGSIFGGSLQTIYGTTEYATIVGGRNHQIQDKGDYAVIIGGELCTVETGATDTQAGIRAIIAASQNCVAGGRQAVIIGTVDSGLQSSYGTIIGSNNVEIAELAGLHVVAFGKDITIGGAANSQYSFAHGETITVDGQRSYAFGQGHDINHNFTFATGIYTKTPCAGARVHATRVRSDVAGNNFSLDFQCSQETTDTTVTRLSVNGPTTYPAQPESSIVNGTFYVTGVSDAGVCSSFTIDVVAERIGSGTATLRANTTNTLYNGLALGTVPTCNVTTSGIFRVQVVGLTATNIRWDARFVGHCVVYA
jgi:hypothetical protein